MNDEETSPEAAGDDKPVEFYEQEWARRRAEAGLEAELRAKRLRSLSESVGDAIDHHRQDENHRAVDGMAKGSIGASGPDEGKR